MPTVFITKEDPELDYSPAREFGDKMVAVFPPGSGQVTFSPQSALGHARKILSGMTQDDFLVLVGDPVMIGLCVAVAAEMVGKVNLLRWKRRTLTYERIAVDFLVRQPA